MRLAGRSAIITGASQGLGEAIADKFVAEGCSVLLCARSERAVEQVGSRLRSNLLPDQKVLTTRTDVAVPDQVDALVARAIDAFGAIDILVNNAGIYGPIGPTHEVDWKEWVDALSINVLGTVYACRTVTAHMISRKRGKIINVSGGGATNPLPRLTSYAAAKAAVVRFTESLALDLKAHGICVNAVAPGALATRMMQQLLDAGEETVGADFYRRMQKIQQDGGTPLSVGAELIAYLASDDSAGITGRLISAVWDPWQTLHQRAAELDKTDIYTLRRIVPADRGRQWDV